MAASLALIPHHDGSSLYVSNDAPVLGDVVRVRLRVPSDFGPVSGVYTRSNPDHEPSFTTAVVVASADGWDWWEAKVEVANPVHGYRFLLRLVDGSNRWINATGMHEVETLDSADFKLVAHPAPPAWVRETVLYQIFPDRFGRSAAADARELPDWAVPAEWADEVEPGKPATAFQFYGGDLDGVIAHLDHLQRLGITLIYLTPVFPAGSNHRYDASNFTVVDPLLGGDEALIRLVEAAHARGLKVIGDLTSNHSGDKHEWFRSAYGDPEAPESGFYYWQNEEHTQYASWLGVPSLPKFDWNSAELRRRFIEGPDSVVAKWLEPPYSLDGWRIDVSNMTGRYLDQDLNEQVRRTIRATMLAVNPDTILIGESTNDASSDFQGDAWHGAMTYANFTRPLWSWLQRPGSPAHGGIGFALDAVPSYTGGEFFESHIRFAAGFPWRTRLATLNALDTHDTPRFLTHAQLCTVPVAFGLAVSLPGIPVVWAGDEFGLIGDDGEHSRTPIPWERAEEGGSAVPSIELYRRLIALKRAHPALNGGGMRWIHVEDDALVYLRESAGETLLFVAARDDFAITLPASVVPPGEAEPLLGDAQLRRKDDQLKLVGGGPSFSAWLLPGLDLPAFE